MLKLFWLQVSWVVCNQVSSLERLSYRVGFEIVFEGLLGCDVVLLGEWLLELLRPFEHLKQQDPLTQTHSVTSWKT